MHLVKLFLYHSNTQYFLLEICSDNSGFVGTVISVFHKKHIAVKEDFRLFTSEYIIGKALDNLIF